MPDGSPAFRTAFVALLAALALAHPGGQRPGGATAGAAAGFSGER